MIENINFRLLNIDKYLTELANTYYNIGQICNIPFYERLSDEMTLKEYKRLSRRIEKGIITHPIAILTNSEIENKIYYENRIKTLTTALHKVSFLDWFTTDKLDTKKKYGLLFDSGELENFKPNTDSVYTWVISIVPNMLVASINEIETNFSTSPLPIIEYYKNKLSKLKSAEFVYLKSILNGDLIQKLDNNNICQSFCFEVLKIKEIQYLENKIFELENPQIEAPQIETTKNKLTQKQIALLFQCLSEIGIFQKNKISQDNSQQAVFIGLLMGLTVPKNINDWDFYKYWLSIQTTDDTKQVLTEKNLQSIETLFNDFDFTDLKANIKQKRKDLK